MMSKLAEDGLYQDKGIRNKVLKENRDIQPTIRNRLWTYTGACTTINCIVIHKSGFFFKGNNF